MSADPEQEFFADGVSEDIITALSKISRLLVVARTSTFTYKGKPVDVKQISREQGVRYVLEGSVRKAGNRVRVTAQLIDATTGLHLWAERYDRDLEDIFAVQDEITREIVVAMDVQLREGEQHRVWSSGTKNLEAWECVRLATDAALGGAAEAQPRARELLDRALELDPDYATAWAMRGWLYFTEADVGGGIGNSDQFDKAQASAFRCGHRALELDPGCAEAYGMLALTHLNAGEHDVAMEMSEKAIALAPNNAEILGGVASAVMRKSGQPERGAELVRKAMRLCPFYRPGLLRALGNNYRGSGRLEEAVACYRESLKRETGYLAAYVNLTSALGELGWLDEAREAARDVLQQEPDFTIKAYTAGLSYRNPSDLERIADGLRQAGLPEQSSINPE
jgi:TolB-like protein/Tfp pilus assembly protein PilF